MKKKNRLYYWIKPILSRSTQIALRRRYVQCRLRKVGNIWPIDSSAGERPAEWGGWPANRKFAFILTHDVENRRGVDRCLHLARTEKNLGLISSFNFVPEIYPLSPQIRSQLIKTGFEVGVHDLKHDGKLFTSKKNFLERVQTINGYLRSWNAVGFRSGSMYHNLAWMHNMEIEYDASTFDTDPFEPQPDGMHTVFPIWIPNKQNNAGYVELPYTLPQDMNLFVLLQHKDTHIWKEKLDWIADKGGMALCVTHPDYMNWGDEEQKIDEYPIDLYHNFLCYVEEKYRGQYWNVLPRDVARFWRGCMASRLTYSR